MVETVCADDTDPIGAMLSGLNARYADATTHNNKPPPSGGD
jgi:hypothetical protein